MKFTLYTVGFTQKTAEEFFRLLSEAGVKKVVDIRENRAGQLQGFARFPDVAYFLRQILGADYVHQPLFAPSPEIREAYRTTHDWEHYEGSFRRLMEERQALEQVRIEDYDHGAALLCSEAEAERCHRRLVAEMLAGKWNAAGHAVEVCHLVIPKPRPKKKRRKGADDRADIV